MDSINTRRQGAVRPDKTSASANRLLEALQGTLFDCEKFNDMQFTIKFLPDLMRPADEVEVVSVEELGDDVGAEGEGDAAVVLAPPLHVLVRVRPQQVAQQARVGHVRRPHDPPVEHR